MIFKLLQIQLFLATNSSELKKILFKNTYAPLHWKIFKSTLKYY